MELWLYSVTPITGSIFVPGRTIAYKMDEMTYHTSWRMYSTIRLSLRPGCLLHSNNKGELRGEFTLLQRLG